MENSTSQTIAALLEQASALLDRGNLNEAYTLYKEACEREPSQAEAWFMRGILETEFNIPTTAFASLSRAVTLDPGHADAHLNLAHLYQGSGQTDRAYHHACLASQLDASFAEAWIMRGLLELSSGAIEVARESFSRATILWPDSAEAFFQLGCSQAALGELRAAADSFRRTTSIEPHRSEAWFQLGKALFGLEDLEGARAGLHRCLALDAHHEGAHALIAELFLAVGDYAAAARHAHSALQVNDLNLAAQVVAGSALLGLGNAAEAERLLTNAAIKHPDSAPLQLRLAGLFDAQGRYDEALKAALHADRLAPSDTAKATIALVHERAGHKAAALQMVQQCLESGSSAVPLLCMYARLAPDTRLRNEAAALLERALTTNSGLPLNLRIDSHSHLGSLYDLLGDYEKAFAHFAQTNSLKQGTYDSIRHHQFIDSIIETFTADRLTAMQYFGAEDATPIFIVGMPRSGTTLVEQILANHPEVHGAGELVFIDEIARSMHRDIGLNTRQYPFAANALTADKASKFAEEYLARIRSLSPETAHITDKLPHNYLHLGLISILLPNARIVHITRNPIDTCLSCYFTNFSSTHSYAYDLVHLADYYKEYERLMQHWRTTLGTRIFEMSYEDLVGNFEATVCDLLECCGLEWSDRCLQFHTSTRAVATPSYNQVRQPIYSKSIGRWRNYRSHIGQLLAKFPQYAENQG